MDGVWQLHILLIDGILGVGVWTLPVVRFVAPLGYRRRFFLRIRYIVWVLSFVFFVVSMSSCIGGVGECFITGYPLLFLRQSNRSVGFNQSLLLSGLGFGARCGWLCDKTKGG